MGLLERQRKWWFVLAFAANGGLLVDNLWTGAVGWAAVNAGCLYWIYWANHPGRLR